MDKTEFDRIREAYINMANEARYRPFAPGDGMGHVDLTPEELSDPDTLAKEAAQYAADFIRKEDAMNFEIGTSNYRTNRALAYTIEAAKGLCGGQDELSLRLLKMAIADIEANPAEERPF